MHLAGAVVVPRQNPCIHALSNRQKLMAASLLVRYGTISEVAKFSHALPVLPERATPVVVRTRRGIELGTVLDDASRTPRPAVSPSEQLDSADQEVTLLRIATADDMARDRRHREQDRDAFLQWQERIRRWGLMLELIDLERTLEGDKLILYVLSGRNAESTKLNIHAAVENLGPIAIETVSPDGLVIPASAEQSCGTAGGCGCHH
jgi:hypothetical protein